MAIDNRIPWHVAIIMDGNGRWAEKRGRERVYGHKEGAESVRACVKYAIKKGIRYLSLFAFSEENWNRPQEEVEALMSLMLKSISDETPLFLQNGIRFRVIGDFSRLSEKLRREIDDCMKLTEPNTTLDLIIFLSYSGKWDILQAVNRYVADLYGKDGNGSFSHGGGSVPQVDARTLSSYLSTAGIPDPDLLIRTSGEQRISNFMLWQTAYTEYYFTEILWPDFRTTEFQLALDAFSQRDRRYGKVK